MIYSSEKLLISIIVSDFNDKITSRLLTGSKNAFYYYNGKKENLNIYHVPGALEIPGMVNQVIKNKESHAIIGIGCIIKGDTYHFNIVANNSSYGLSKLSVEHDIPIINCILATNNIEQALERSQYNKSNNGWYAMETAIKTISIYQEVNSSI